MSNFSQGLIIGYHSCDREVGLRVLNARDSLLPSDNPWDWLGDGIYFWENNPYRALTYAIEASDGRQKNKSPIKTPFVIGAVIQLGYCFDLLDENTSQVLSSGYTLLSKNLESLGEKIPENKGSNRALDCAVIKFIHRANAESGNQPYDTVRGAFHEGDPVYPGAQLYERTHVQVAVRNPECIIGYFLPLPVGRYNHLF